MFAASLALTFLFGGLFSGSIPRFFATCLASVALNAALIMAFGVGADERRAALSFVRGRLGGAR